MDTPEIASTTAEQAKEIRKPRSQKRQREYRIHLRLTAEEDASLRAKAHAAGKRPGDFVRALIAEKEIKAAHPDNYYLIIRNIGSNLNQIAKHLNLGTTPAKDTLAEVLHLCSEVHKNASR